MSTMKFLGLSVASGVMCLLATLGHVSEHDISKTGTGYHAIAFHGKQLSHEAHHDYHGDKPLTTGWSKANY